MKLSDINETMFQSLSPEVQTQLIETASRDNLSVYVIVAALFIIPMILMN